MTTPAEIVKTNFIYKNIVQKLFFIPPLMTKLTKTKTLLLFSLRFLSAAEGQTPWNYLIVLVGIFVAGLEGKIGNS